MSFKITEEALEQEVAAVLAHVLGCTYVTQGGIGGGQFDILLTTKKHTLVLELKIGKGQTKFAESIAQANRYKETLNANGIIALMYPETVRRVVTCEEDVRDLAVSVHPEALILSPFLNDHYWDVSLDNLAKIIKTHMVRPVLTVSPALVARTLRDCVQGLATKLKRSMGIARPAIDEVVGSFDLFKVLAGEDDRTSRVTERSLESAACDLAGYILMNQLLLYHLLCETLNLPPLRPLSAIQELADSFHRVTKVDYRAVYSVDLVSRFPKSALRDINVSIEALKAVRPERVPHDLLGRVFHEFLPFETRKLLGAFYTKPVGAEILAGLAIDGGKQTVIDPACGSGTLLVGAYRRKRLLAGHRAHRTILEKDITGIDIMPFAAHLSALNLTLQNTKQKTNRTRIGIANSMEIQPGSELGTLPDQLWLFTQKQPTKAVTVDRLRDHHETFHIPERVDVVIMNPPFTRKERLQPDMMGQFGKSFEQRQNYWAYFLAWADSLLGRKGRLAAVLPRDLFAGQHSKNVREWLFSRDTYRIRFIVKTVNEIAFSENAKFRDFLVILEKKSKIRKGGVVYLKRKLDTMSMDYVNRLVSRILRLRKNCTYEDDDIAVSWFDQSLIRQNWPAFWAYVSLSRPGNAETLVDFHEHVLEKGSKHLVRLKDTEIDVIRGLEPTSKGMLNAIFGVRPLDKRRVERSALVVQREDKKTISMGLRGLERTFAVPKTKLERGLKTPSYLTRYDVEEMTDWVIMERFKDFEKIEKIQGVGNIHFHALVEQASRRRTHLAVSRRFDLTASGTCATAYFCTPKVLLGKAFWAVKTGPLYSKALCLWFNSTISFLQLLLGRTETRGSWCELPKNALERFWTPSFRFVDRHSSELLQTFDSVSQVDLRPLIEQYKTPTKERILLDTVWLELLGFGRREVRHVLPNVYEAIADELETMKQAMRAASRKRSVQEPIWPQEVH